MSCRRAALLRRSWSLLEMVVVLAIVVILGGLLLASSRYVLGSRRTATAQQQLALIAQAIEKYAEAWPAWAVDGVIVAEKGWPDFCPARLFRVPPFGLTGGYNDTPDFDVDNVFYPAPARQINGLSDVCDAGTALAYSLQAAAAGGPFLKDIDGAGLKTLDRVDGAVRNATYPSLASESSLRTLFVDPWGTPLRYFWVYRDLTPPPTGPTAPRGLIAVDYGAFDVGSGVGGIDNAAYQQLIGPPAVHKTAVGFVLESAGPDRRFGNVWKQNPSAIEREAASDNIVIAP